MFRNNIRNKRIICYISFVLLPIIFFLPVLVSDSIITAGDGIGYEAQFEVIRNALQEGEFPQWTRFIANGTPFAADVQNKVFYPVVYLCLLFPRHIDFKIFYILHIVLNAIFSFILFDKLTKSNSVSFYGALVTSFSNMLILRMDHINILCNIVWIPLLIYLLIQLFDTNKKIYSLYLGITIALQFFAGFPQIAFYCDLILFFLYVYFSLNRRMNVRDFFLNGIIIGITFLGIAAVQILPLAELTVYSGRNVISYEYFSEYSADVRFLFSLFNPIFWGEWSSFLGIGLEFPSDMYIGIIPLTLAIYAIIYCRKRNDIKILECVGGIAFILACACNNIPFLGKVLYKLPIFNSFRTLIRLEIFFVGAMLWLGVMGLQHIIENRMYNKISLVTVWMFGIYMLLCVSFIVIGKNNGFTNPSWNEYYANFQWCYKSIIVFILAFICWILAKKYINRIGARTYMVVMIVVLISIWDVFFFNVDTASNVFRHSGILKNGNHSETFEGEEISFLENIPEKDRGKYFVSYESWEDLERTKWGLRVNGNIYNKLSSIQSYITFNNPLLLELCNADYGMMMNAEGVMAFVNPTFLQMLSTRYIVADNRYHYSWNGFETVFESYPLVREDSFDQHISIPVDLALNQSNILNLHINIKEGSSGLSINFGNNTLYCQELSSGDNYIECAFERKDLSETSLDLYFSSSDMDKIEVLGVRIEQSCKEEEQSFYQKVYTNSQYTIMELRDAQALIFSPERVVRVENPQDYILENKNTIDFVKTSYIQDSKDMDLSNVETQINITDITSNSISANVYASSDSWINYSQSPYRGWKVYIDGKKQETLAVNGLIQGTLIEKGNHVVTFQFSSPTLFLGAIISLFTFGTVMFFIIRNRIGCSKKKNK